MPRNVKIIVKRGAQIVESRDGSQKFFPQIRTVSAEIPTMGELQTDPENNYRCWEFKFQGRTWTVDADQVEVIP